MRRDRRFAVAMTAVLGVLVLAAGVLAVLGAVRGPVMTGAQVNLRAAEAAAGQRLVLASDQALDESVAPTVTVDPEVPVTVSVQSTSVTVQLESPLAYATDYTVTVHGVAGALGNARSDWSHGFTTPDVSGLLVLRPGAEADEIAAVGIDDGSEVVYRGAGIVSYAATPAALAVVQRDPSTGLDTVTVVPRQGGDPTVLDFPAAGTVTSIRAAPDGSMIGLTYTQPQTDFTAGGADLLFTYDLVRGGGLPELVPDASGEQISAVDWAFVPGSAQLLAITPAGTLLRVDAVDAFAGDAVAVDLGTATAIRGTLGAAAAVIVDEGDALSLVTADSVSPTPWSAAEPDSRATIVDASGTVLRTDGDRLELVSPSGARSALLETGADLLSRVCVSPNGLYAAVVAGDATSLVSLGGAGVSAGAVTTVDGIAPSWCS